MAFRVQTAMAVAVVAAILVAVASQAQANPRRLGGWGRGHGGGWGGRRWGGGGGWGGWGGWGGGGRGGGHRGDTRPCFVEVPVEGQEGVYVEDPEFPVVACDEGVECSFGPLTKTCYTTSLGLFYYCQNPIAWDSVEPFEGIMRKACLIQTDTKVFQENECWRNNDFCDPNHAVKVVVNETQVLEFRYCNRVATEDQEP